MKRLYLPLIAGIVAVAALALLTPAAAQGQTETKIRLMADALRARDAGDYQAAKANLEQLLAIVLNDPTARRLLEGVNRAIAGGESAAPSYDAPEPYEPAQDDRAPRRLFGSRTSESSPSDRVAGDVDSIARAEEQRLYQLMESAREARREAQRFGSDGRYDEAITVLDNAIAALPSNPLTEDTLKDLKEEKADVLLAKSRRLMREGDTRGARDALAGYEASSGRRGSRIDRELLNPPNIPIQEANPNFLPERAEIAAMIAKGRSQYLAGDIDGAGDTFRKVEAIDADNAEAKTFLKRIAEKRAEVGVINRQKTRASMLQEVAQGWQRPGVYQDRSQDATGAAAIAPLEQKLGTITIPSVNFSGVDLARVISTLSAISEEYDAPAANPKGVNIVLIDPSNTNPSVNISLRNLSLKRVLDFITDSVGYQYDVQADAVVVRPGGERSLLDTAFFPISRATVIRMTGSGGSASQPSSVAVNDPFAPSASTTSASPAPSGESAALKSFLQQAGVNFDGTTGSSLVYDGSAMIVTQTGRNIERIRNILNRYNDVRQVEIEAKFMEVQEGALEELGVDWSVGRRGDLENYTLKGRSLSDAFSPSGTESALKVIRPEVSSYVTDADGAPVVGPDGNFLTNTIAGINEALPIVPPLLPGRVDIGTGASPLGVVSGVIGEFDVSAVIRALSRKTGSDLLSAPKVTVLSGNPAQITVAQELRYPQSYSDIQSEVGRGGSTDSGSSAGVTITAGTPQDFATRNIGVELRVTPTVEEDDYSISLELNPRVTEFEGFVEYGGPSIAISGGTTVTVPSGFFQPIFSTREVSTKVTIWDGATLVMGGLTREEVKKVNDKVPVLGNLPVVGRMFRSEGETSAKRNLLIFVTANLVSPGGSPKKQQLKNVLPSSLYQNPTIVTPSGSEPRPVRGGE
ncbi:MAG TPA: type II secretory pathway, component PulD [Opitutaceae bacterium]|nr:type II secretory pathway, component PulD [Opitutaceae bacterium]